MHSKPTHIVILAAGLGKRMFSSVPKVLHRLAGIPILQHIINTAEALQPAAIHVVYGHNGEQVRQELNTLKVNWVNQTEQLGTGHALLQVLPLLNDNDNVVVLCGDTPLVSAALLKKLLLATPTDGVGIVTTHISDPTGLGRIVRDQNGQLLEIVEEKDATVQQRQLKEVYTGIMVAGVKQLRQWLSALTNHNAQGEYYLTDVIKLALAANVPVVTIEASCWQEVQGINDRAQLALLERYYQSQIAQQLLLQGVTLLDPQRLDVRGELHVGKDVIIDVNVILEGAVELGSGCHIGPNCFLRNVKIGNNVQILANTVIEEAHIANDCRIGPFARIRPQTQLANGVHVGNFVEIKKSHIGEHSNVNHLSYVGDATIGKNVNVGAGTITCNYDGANKYQTIIGDNVHIGSDTQLIAPVTVGADATIAAGSTVAKDVPAGGLTLTSQIKQRTLDNWQRPLKKKD